MEYTKELYRKGTHKDSHASKSIKLVICAVDLLSIMFSHFRPHHSFQNKRLCICYCTSVFLLICLLTRTGESKGFGYFLHSKGSGLLTFLVIAICTTCKFQVSAPQRLIHTRPHFQIQAPYFHGSSGTCLKCYSAFHISRSGILALVNQTYNGWNSFQSSNFRPGISLSQMIRMI